MHVIYDVSHNIAKVRNALEGNGWKHQQQKWALSTITKKKSFEKERKTEWDSLSICFFSALFRRELLPYGPYFSWPSSSFSSVSSVFLLHTHTPIVFFHASMYVCLDIGGKAHGRWETAHTPCASQGFHSGIPPASSLDSSRLSGCLLSLFI